MLSVQKVMGNQQQLQLLKKRFCIQWWGLGEWILLLPWRAKTKTKGKAGT